MTRTLRRPLTFVIVSPPVVALVLLAAGAPAGAQIASDGTGASSAAPPAQVSPAHDPTTTSRAAEPGGGAPAAASAPSASESSAATPHPRSILDLTIGSFAIGNGAGGQMPLTGLELDLHLLWTSWLRAGISAGAGRGQGKVEGSDVSARYGTLGLAAALQVPTRFSPFIAGRVSGGVLAGSLDSALAIPGTPVSVAAASGATWIYTRGLDLGAELYTFGSLHLIGSVGWVRATWRGPDVVAMEAAPAAGLKLTDVRSDTVALKLGLGF